MNKELELQVFLVFYYLDKKIDYTSLEGWELYRDIDYDTSKPVKTRLFNQGQIITSIEKKRKKLLSKNKK
ncbi:MAG: hypothetical protein ACPGJV_10175 [Bacteriovoracaceae bacterium]